MRSFSENANLDFMSGNLSFKKFSIEVHDAKRVVQTLSNFNLYEDALKLDNAAGAGKDELVDAIGDSTTQVGFC